MMSVLLFNIWGCSRKLLAWGEEPSVKTQVQPLLLLLLLGLWVAKVPVSATCKHMTSARWFETQHAQPRPQNCNIMMINTNQYLKHCKPLNTFVHDSFASVATICQTPIITCKNGCENCHLSQEPVSLTMCEHISGKYPDRGTVARDPPQQKDGQESELVPVHLDSAF
ncbi:ribonuclease 7 [Echinops telfairi]|uniref:Ribonuclease 7 n=1 Tax=Echinops telfairi TaxID=9371 RepID=A0ABM1VJ55_ECHTE|nr:ribonuclease 7 [Echinops telfairi]